MKKYYEYDAPVLTKLVSVVAVIAMCVSMATSCITCYKVVTLETSGTTSSSSSDDSDSSSSSSSSSSTSSSSSSSSSSTDDETTTAASSSDDTDTSSSDDETTTAASSSDDTDTSSSSDDTDTSTSSSDDTSTTSLSVSEILAKYDEVMSQAYTDCPGFTRLEYQDIPSEYRNLGSLGNLILSIAANFVTAYEDAEESVYEQGGDMKKFPVTDCYVGNYLTDTSAIKSASLVENSDGTVTISITLNDDVDPEPTTAGEEPTSYVGSMFAPLSVNTINETLETISAITVNSFSCNYTDCTTEVTYDPDTNEISYVYQVMYVDVTLDVTAVIVNVQGSARVVWECEYYDFVY